MGTWDLGFIIERKGVGVSKDTVVVFVRNLENS